MEQVEDALLKSLGIKKCRKQIKPKQRCKDHVETALTADRIITVDSIIRPGKNIVTLCPICKNEYLDAGYVLIKRSESSSVKETCCKCNFRTGYDFEVTER
jgi:hypothetical protein